MKNLIVLFICTACFLACSEDDTESSTSAGTEAAGTEAAGTEAAGTETAGTATAGTATAGTATAGTATAGTETAGTETAGTETAGTETAGTETAGTETAGTETAGTSAMMGDCDVSCGAFAQCAVDECVGYDESGFDALKEGCLGTCTPVLATIFDSKVTCQEKFDFVSTVRATFPAYCASTTNGYCERIDEYCGGWSANASCEEWYSSSEPGMLGDTAGATQACYNYHSVAAAEDADLHCPHARGEEVCVGDDNPMPMEGACTNEADTTRLTELGENDLNAQIEGCIPACLNTADIPACSQCLEEATGLSTGCTDCFADVTACTVTNCVAQCAVDPSGDACTECREDNCNADFVACSGINP